MLFYINKNHIANYLSLYFFSTKNFNRSADEVNYIMDLFIKWFKKFKEKYNKVNIKVLFSSQKNF